MYIYIYIYTYIYIYIYVYTYIPVLQHRDAAHGRLGPVGDQPLVAGRLILYIYIYIYVHT